MNCKRLQLQPMNRPNPTPTIEDVARRAQVSTATVSRVVNGLQGVRPATAARVQQAIAELEYAPSQAARVLASRRTDTLGLLLPEIGGLYFQPLLRGIEAAAGEAGYNLLINTTRMARPEARLWNALGEHNTDGLLVFADSLDEAGLQRLFRSGFPAVFLHQTPPAGVEMPVVTIENQSGALQIVEHLISAHARRRIVFLQGPEGHEDSHWREKGYRAALQAHGLRFDAQLVARGGFNRVEARQAVEGLLAAGIAFDAVFCGDDDSAVGVLAALKQAGRSVPGQVSVAGFDDQVIASSTVPALTTVRAHTEQVGREAVRALVRRIHGEPVEPLLILPVELVLRESCGCRPAETD
jgi:DNA-binding LacI/PurR family transcriptional regulator